LLWHSAKILIISSIFNDFATDFSIAIMLKLDRLLWSIKFLKYDLIFFIHEKILSHAAEDTDIVIAIVHNLYNSKNASW
jgi:hypothetical protein